MTAHTPALTCMGALRPFASTAGADNTTTNTGRMVTHPSTNGAHNGLSSVIGPRMIIPSHLDALLTHRRPPSFTNG